MRAVWRTTFRAGRAVHIFLLRLHMKSSRTFVESRWPKMKQPTQLPLALTTQTLPKELSAAEAKPNRAEPRRTAQEGPLTMELLLSQVQYLEQKAAHPLMHRRPRCWDKFASHSSLHILALTPGCRRGLQDHPQPSWRPSCLRRRQVVAHCPSSLMPSHRRLSLFSCRRPWRERHRRRPRRRQ